MFNRKLLVAFLAAGALAGCDNGSSSKKQDALPEVINTAPTISIAAVEAVEPGAAVTVEATATDAEDNIATFEWVQTAGTTVQLSGADTNTLSFTAPAAETATKLTFTLTVIDEEGESDSAEVTVDVLANAAPAVSIEAIDPVLPNETVTLKAYATDDHSEEISFAWSQTAGEDVTVSGNGDEATFISPATGLLNKKLSFEVRATDANKVSATATTDVTVIGEIQAVTDAVVKWDFSTVSNGDNGYLFTDQPTGEGLYEWPRNQDRANANISAPISRYLARAGYIDQAILGFEDMYLRTSADPTNPDNFSSQDLGTFLFAYDLTGEAKYLEVASNMFDAVTEKYTASSPREPWYWAFDYYSILYGAAQAYAHGLEGSEDYYNTLTTAYTDRISTFGSDSSADLDYHTVVINMIYEELGIGNRIDTFTFDDLENQLGIQYTAYALIGKSVDEELGASFILEHIYDTDNYSQPVAEAVGALHIYMDRMENKD